MYIKLTLPFFFDCKIVGGNYFTFTSPFQCYAYFYISYASSVEPLIFQDNFFEYSRFLMWQGHTSDEGNYYPMRKEYKSAYYAGITTACGAKYTLFLIHGNTIHSNFLRHEFVASDSQWKNFHSDFVEFITLE